MPRCAWGMIFLSTVWMCAFYQVATLMPGLIAKE
jgi:hypothetical protein